MAKIVAQLSEKYSDNMEILFSEFNTSKEEQEKLRSRMPETKMLAVILEFAHRSKNEELKDAVIKLGITKHDLIGEKIWISISCST